MGIRLGHIGAVSVAAASLLIAVAPASGGVQFFDLDGGQQSAWDQALQNAGLQVLSATAWAGLPDFGLTGMDGPADTNTSNSVFSPGDIPADLAFDSNTSRLGAGGASGRGPGGLGLVASGPTGMFGTANALLANDSDDSFDIFSVGSNHTAFEATVLRTGFSGAQTVDITVYNGAGIQVGQLLAANANGANGARWGILVDVGAIGRVNVDAGGGFLEFGGVLAVKTYSSDPNPTDGGCCLSTGPCLDDMTQETCECSGGVFLGAGVPCDQQDSDADSVPDVCDACPATPIGVAVDEQGRPRGDFDADCDTDLADFALFQQGFTGPG
ncbi:MAG: hypothetical protein ACYSUI_06690 [Planctomycetota bacterium]